MSIHYDARAHTGAEGNHDEVFHTASHAIGHFTHCSGIGIVGDATRDAQRFFKEFGNRHHALPNEVGGILNGAIIKVSIGSADAHTAHFLNAAHHVKGGLQGFNSCCHIVFHIGVGFGLDGRLRKNCAALVYNTEY